MELDIHIFKNEKNIEPFTKWLNKLDKKNKFRILQRIERLKYGNFGDCKQIFDNLYELRMFFGSGYRIYFGKDSDKLVILLTAGDKKTQKQDILKAKEYWRQYNDSKI